MLNVSAPALPSSTTALEKPLVATLAAPKFADGTAAAAHEVTTIGVLAFRGTPGSAQVWDDGSKTWRSVPSDIDLMRMKPLAGAPKDGAWQATLVGIGQKDAAGADVYVVAAGGTPQYFLRTLAKTKRGTASDSGLSGASQAFTFTSSVANTRYTLTFDTPDTKPDAAHKARMLLKSDTMKPAGYIEVRALPSFEVEIANCDFSGNPLAKVLLQSNGEIHLMPASGQRVVIDGDVETGRILYAPAGGGAKVWVG
jgi:hypothetical protein